MRPRSPTRQPRWGPRPPSQARRERISGIFDRGATPLGGMQRRPNADALLPRAASPADLSGIRNALFVRTDRIGDLICCVPAIRAFRRRCPDARVTGLLSPINADLLRGTDLVDDVLLWRRGAGLQAWLDDARALRARGFDCVLLFVTSDDAYGLARVVGARIRAGAVIRRRLLIRPYAAACLTHRHVFDQDARYRSGEPLVHEAEKAMGVVRAIGIDEIEHHVRFSLPAEVVQRCRDRLLRGADRRPVIAVPLCRRYTGGGWSVDDVRRIAEAIAQAFPDALILVTAGHEEADAGRQLRERFSAAGARAAPGRGGTGRPVGRRHGCGRLRALLNLSPAPQPSARKICQEPGRSA